MAVPMLRRNRDSRRLDVATCLVLTLLIAWTAWDFGGAYQRTKWSVAVALAALLAVRFFGRARDFRLPNPPPAIALVACAIWMGGLLQTISLPSSLTAWLSPGSVAAYRDFIPEPIRIEAASISGGWLNHEFDASGSVPVSVAPELTRVALAIPACFAVAVWLAFLAFGSKRIGLLFLLMVTFTGGILAFFGLADAVLIAQGSGSETWHRLILTPKASSSAFGPFVNNNNAGGFFNLAIGCAVGALGCLVHWRASRRKTDHTSQRMTFHTLLRRGLIVFLMLLLIVLIAAVLGSKSRGAFLGLISGAVCLSIVVMYSRAKSKCNGTLVAVGIAACFLLSSAGLFARFHGRVKTLWSGEALGDPRLEHWRDSWAAAVQHLPAGAGLGTYRYAHLPYQTGKGTHWFVHADGMPFECLLEGGVWLILLIVIGLALIIRDLFRVARLTQHHEMLHDNGTETQEAFDRVTANGFVMALVFAIPATVVTQCFDYGILQPPLLLTLACLCGGLAAHATSGDEAFGTSSWARRPLQSPKLIRAIPTFAGFLLCVGIASAVMDLSVAASVEGIERGRLAASHHGRVDRDAVTSDLTKAYSLLKLRPQDASVHLLLAQLLIEQQQAAGASYLLEEGLATEHSVGRFVSIRTLRNAYHRSADAVRTAQPPAKIEAWMLPGQDVDCLKSARAHAAFALTKRPLDDVARTLLIELDVLDPEFTTVTPALIGQLKDLRGGNRILAHYLRRVSSTVAPPSYGASNRHH